MEMKLPKITRPIQAEFELPLSKSMANRGLLLAALYPEITLTGISTAKDSVFLRETLDAYAHGEVHVGAGGTTLRFATAYWATLRIVHHLRRNARIEPTFHRTLGGCIECVRRRYYLHKCT